MRAPRFWLTAVLGFSTGIGYGQSPWTPKHATIETRWAKDISSTNALPEYPRPQFVRKQWRCLNGIWDFGTGPTQNFSQKILVPYAVETAASGIMEHHDRLWYRRSFSVPKEWNGKHLLLHFDAVDYESEVFVNGRSFGIHKGGYESFTYDISSALKSGGKQNLMVRVFDPTEAGGQPRGKQTTKPGGIMYTPTSGIWQTVWMEPVSGSAIDSLKIIPDVDRQSVHLTVRGANGTLASVKILDGQKAIKTLTMPVNVEQEIRFAHPKLWSPDHPFLYDLDVSLVKGPKVTDHVSSYFGMRKISLGQVAGVTKMLLNNRFVFEIGTLDQGYWPESGLTPPTDAAMRGDIATMKQLGFNMVRKHIKVEPARWYYWTDRLGLMVWQDMPSPNSYIDNPPPVDKPAFEKEVVNVIETHINVPSIIMWVVFNESQGRHDTAKLVNLVKSLDPSRLADRDSGSGYEPGERMVGDVEDVHSYPPPGVAQPTQSRALVCGEYGGLGLIVKGHTWKKDEWGYALFSNSTDLEETYGEFTAKLKNFQEKNGLSAAVYTQITDVELESNGLMTYDRHLKVDPKQIALANRFAYPVPTYETVVPTSEAVKQSWSYTIHSPSPAWFTVDFDTSEWQTGLGGFGHSVAPGNPLGTTWESSDIWLKRQFTLPSMSAKAINQIMVRDCHDEDIEVYINGVKAYSAGGYIGDYEVRAISDKARASLKLGGLNTLAVHCHQTTGGQFIDVGIVRKIPAKS